MPRSVLMKAFLFHSVKNYLLSLLFCLCPLLIQAQIATGAGPAETHHYAIEIARIRVGTMTAIRQPQAGNRTLYTLISDVKVNLLVYTVKIYYKVINQFEEKNCCYPPSMCIAIGAIFCRGRNGKVTTMISGLISISITDRPPKASPSTLPVRCFISTNRWVAAGSMPNTLTIISA